MADFPFDEVVKTANDWIAKGGTVHQKFTCAKCGSRQGMETPNVFYTSGTCEECGHVTDIKAQGCNYLLTLPVNNYLLTLPVNKVPAKGETRVIRTGQRRDTRHTDWSAANAGLTARPFATQPGTHTTQRNPAMKIAILNATTVLSNADAQSVVAPLQRQLTEYTAPAWEMLPPALRFVEKDGTVLADEAAIVLIDNLGIADALGFHDITKTGRPMGKVGVETTINAGMSWTVTTSHETNELFIDPEIQLTATRQTSRTIEFYAREACDACENDRYGMDIDGVLLSDVLTPPWFAQHETSGQKYDLTGNITAPFQLLPGGYNGVYIPGRGWTQVVHAEQRHGAAFRGQRGSRRERRTIGRELWVHSTAV